jgi:hypothetical protein
VTGTDASSIHDFFYLGLFLIGDAAVLREYFPLTAEKC